MTGSSSLDPNAVLRPPPAPEWTEQRALDEKPPPEPVRVSLGWRILGWIWSFITGMAGG